MCKYDCGIMEGLVNSLRKISIAATALLFSAGAAAAADMAMPVKAPVSKVPAEWLNVFAGFSTSPDSNYGEAGAVFAINGNLRTDGWLVRLKGGFGHYNYNSAPGVERGVDFSTGDFMVGYQKFFGPTLLSLYVGANVQDHDNDDPLAEVKGTKWGAKVRAELYTALSDRWYGLVSGEYSSAFDSYFAQGKLGYVIVPGVSVGPELAALGNDRFDDIRYGAFVAFDLARSAQLILSGGYADDTRANALNDHSGGYFTAHVRANF